MRILIRVHFSEVLLYNCLAGVPEDVAGIVPWMQ